MGRHDVIREMYCSSILIVDALGDKSVNVELFKKLRDEAALSLLKDGSLSSIDEDNMLCFCSELLYLLSRMSEFSMINYKESSSLSSFKLLNEEMDCILTQFS